MTLSDPISAMQAGSSLAHSEPVKCELSLPDAAGVAAPRSVHIDVGPVRGALYEYKAFSAQLDWLHG